MQALPALCLFFGLLLCNESPRWLARQDNWEKATSVLSKVTKYVCHFGESVEVIMAELIKSPSGSSVCSDGVGRGEYCHLNHKDTQLIDVR